MGGSELRIVVSIFPFFHVIGATTQIKKTHAHRHAHIHIHTTNTHTHTHTQTHTHTNTNTLKHKHTKTQKQTADRSLHKRKRKIKREWYKILRLFLVKQEKNFFLDGTLVAYDLFSVEVNTKMMENFFLPSPKRKKNF